MHKTKNNPRITMEFVFYMLKSNKTSAVALHTVRSINNPNAIRTSSVKFKYRCYTAIL